MVTLVRGGLVVAFVDGGHVAVENGEVAIDGNRIVYVGKNYEGKAEAVIDARRDVVVPGFLSLHAHTTSSHYVRSFLEDVGSKQFYMSGLYEYISPIIRAVRDEEALVACKAAVCELLKSGCTFFLEMGTSIPHDVAKVAVEAGIRACVVPGYYSARWRVDEKGTSVLYDWDEEKGFKMFEQNLRFLEDCKAYRGMVSSVLGPMQLDTCSVDLLRATVEKSKERNIRVQIHAAQSIVEFQEIMKRHGQTPVQYMKSLGLLSPLTMIAHCIYVSDHPHTLAPWGNDLQLLAESGASVVHCPTVFIRRGAALHSYGRYSRAGINIALGTDTVPHDMLMEMRTAAYMAKMVENNCFVGTAKELFNSATLNGAKALGRDDVGVLKAGALADIVVIDAGNTRMSPMRDPLKNIVYHAAPSNIKTVIVNGDVVVENGEVVNLDETKVAEELQKTAEKVWERLNEFDWGRRTVNELSPLSINFLR